MSTKVKIQLPWRLQVWETLKWWALAEESYWCSVERGAQLGPGYPHPLEPRRLYHESQDAVYGALGFGICPAGLGLLFPGCGIMFTLYLCVLNVCNLVLIL